MKQLLFSFIALVINFVSLMILVSYVATTPTAVFMIGTVVAAVGSVLLLFKVVSLLRDYDQSYK